MNLAENQNGSSRALTYYSRAQIALVGCGAFMIGSIVAYSISRVCSKISFGFITCRIPALPSHAFTNRHDPVTLEEYEPDRIARGYKYHKQFLHHPVALSRQQYVDRISDGNKRAIYQSALDDLQQSRGYISRIQPFTKLEKLSVRKYKAPRMIQARHISFNIEYGIYIKPLKNSLGKDKHKPNRANHTRLIGLRWSRQGGAVCRGFSKTRTNTGKRILEIA